MKFGFSVTLFYPQQKKTFTRIIFLYDQCQHHVESRELRFSSSGKSFSFKSFILAKNPSSYLGQLTILSCGSISVLFGHSISASSKSI